MAESPPCSHYVFVDELADIVITRMVGTLHIFGRLNTFSQRKRAICIKFAYSVHLIYVLIRSQAISCFFNMLGDLMLTVEGQCQGPYSS